MTSRQDGVPARSSIQLSPVRRAEAKYLSVWKLGTHLAPCPFPVRSCSALGRPRLPPWLEGPCAASCVSTCGVTGRPGSCWSPSRRRERADTRRSAG